MPKKIDYPRASLKNALELASAVDKLGGQCSIESAADKLGKKVSGAFKDIVGAAVKHGLITSKGGRLAVSQGFRDYKLAYNPEEKIQVLARSFLQPPLYKDIADRFEGRELPVSHFGNFLVREFGVAENFASRTSKYFLEGAKLTELLGSGNVLLPNASGGTPLDHPIDPPDDVKGSDPPTSDILTSMDQFSVRITGPGINSTVVIEDETDLVIVDAMLKKIRKEVFD